MNTFDRVVLNVEAGVSFETYASLDNNAWGLIAYASMRNPYANIGHEWEVGIEGQDEYRPGIAQTFYSSMEDAITENATDFSLADNEVCSLTPEDFKTFMAEHFEDIFYAAGVSAPSGGNYYRLKPDLDLSAWIEAFGDTPQTREHFKKVKDCVS